MTAVIVSPDYRIDIPPEVRDTLNIKPGQKLEIFSPVCAILPRRKHRHGAV
jgi:AbrB family looped-hinge helix DNA binding protein